jgi:arylsulfatase A-like enzyme
MVAILSVAIVRRWRQFAVLVMLVIGSLLRCGEASAIDGLQARNILVLIADDLGVDASSFYPLGLREQTNPPPPPMPNVRKLADAGILFSNAWASPFCAPGRGTIFTGRYAFRTGLGSNLEKPEFQRLTEAEFITPEAFDARPGLGYELAHIGKWHVSGGDTDPNQFGWPYFSGAPPVQTGVRYFKWVKHINATSTLTTTYATTDSVNEAIAAIGRAGGAPYYIEVAFNAPHSPLHKPPNDLHSYDALPPPQSGVNPRPYFEAMSESLDTEIGRLLNSVNLANTTVIFLSDNGSAKDTVVPPYDPNRSKGTMYQNGIRVPMLIAGAGVSQPNRVVDALVSTVDILPTVLDLAGIDLQSVIPPGTKIDGISMVPYMQNPGAGGLHEFIYSERFKDRFDHGWQRAIRNAEFKLITRHLGSPEFYNLRLDPLEHVNLLSRALSTTEQANLASLENQLATLLATR